MRVVLYEEKGQILKFSPSSTLFCDICGAKSVVIMRITNNNYHGETEHNNRTNRTDLCGECCRRLAAKF